VGAKQRLDAARAQASADVPTAAER
jgi:hypothetical protein